MLHFSCIQIAPSWIEYTEAALPVNKIDISG